MKQGTSGVRSQAESWNGGRGGTIPWELVESSLSFVVWVSRDYRDKGLPLEDLVGEGNLGLIEAARRFDPERGVRFTSFAVWWIRKAILDALYRQSSLVRVPDYLLREARVVERTRRNLGLTLGRMASREEIGRAAGVSSREVEKTLLLGRREVPLEDSARPGEPRRPTSRRETGTWGDPEEQLLRSQRRELVRRLLSHLSGPEREVVISRYGLNGGETRTLKETGERLGVSQERVRQIEVQAKRRLLKILHRRPGSASALP
jgi:RNA polymerase primary sigma factor